MIETKLFEIRDKGTFIPACAVLCESQSDEEAYLLRRAGYGAGTNLVLLTRLDGGKSSYDPYDWGGRTWPVAHQYIAQHWFDLKSGDVVDVEVALGETITPKLSERVA